MATKPAETPAADTPPPAPAAEPANFNDAFAAAAASDEPGFDAVPPPPPPPAPEPAPLEVPGGDVPPPAPAPEAAPAAGTPPVDEPPAPEGAVQPPAPAPVAPAAPTAEDIVKQLAEQLKTPPPAPAPVAQQEEAPPLYTPEEVTVLTDYEKNWPDVAQAEALKRRGEYHDLMKYVFTEVHSFLQPHLAQIAAMGNAVHENELRQALPDYSADEEPAVAAWVETQPSYLQAGMKQVMQSGTSEEVVDLIGRYRAATGKAPAQAAASDGAPPAPAPAPVAPAKTELSNLAKQAAESLAPVSSDRTQVPAGEDPGDFNSAFARYASEAAPPS